MYGTASASTGHSATATGVKASAAKQKASAVAAPHRNALAEVDAAAEQPEERLDPKLVPTLLNENLVSSPDHGEREWSLHYTSRTIVTGPSFTSSTAIRAPKAPRSAPSSSQKRS